MERSHIVIPICILRSDICYSQTTVPVTNEPLEERSLEILKVMASGTYGRVLKAEHRATKELLAIKVSLAVDFARNAADHELQILQRLADNPHSCILQLRGHYCSTTNDSPTETVLHIVTDFYSFTLLSLLDSYYNYNVTMPLFDATLYFYQLLLAVSHMHSLGLCHRYVTDTVVLLQLTSELLLLCYLQRYQA